MQRRNFLILLGGHRMTVPAIHRRAFISLLGGAAAAVPRAARAQSAMPVIGFLHSQARDEYAAVLAGFRQGLLEAGLLEGRNVAVEYRWANDRLGQLPLLAADLVQRRVAVIVAGGGPPSTLAAKAATTTIPIVLVTGSDPVRLGLVASLNRPGGNVTGVTFMTAQLMGKRLGLLRDLVPQAKTIGYLSDSRIKNETLTEEVVAAADTIDRQLIVIDVRSEGDFEAAFATLVERRADALLVGAFPVFTSNRAKVVALAARHRIPTMYQNRDYAVDGGLISYGASQEDAFRLGGTYVGKILKGAKPVDLPVQQSVRFELVINVKTAKTLGLEIPPLLLAIADETIE
jgi:putative ABC transport system substrate-binding protein